MAARAIGSPFVVFDAGSGLFKAGVSGEKLPRAVVPNVLGRPKTVNPFSKKNDPYAGEEAYNRRGLLNLSFPIERGNQSNWEDVEKMYQHLYTNELRHLSEEHPVLLSEGPFHPRALREKNMELFFEKFNVPLYTVHQAGVLDAYAAGVSSGLVLDVGHGVTQAVPVIDGAVVPYAIERVHFAGDELSGALLQMMEDSGVQIKGAGAKYIATEIKDKRSYVSLSYDADVKKPVLKPYVHELPDGNVVDLGSELFRCMEPIFQPSLLGVEFQGVHELVAKAIGQADEKVRIKLFANVVVAGGTSTSANFIERLESELTPLVPEGLKLGIKTINDRKFATFIGGSIMGELSTTREKAITKEEYKERGASNLLGRRFPIYI